MKKLLAVVLILAAAFPAFAQYTVDAGQDRIVIQGKDGQQVVNISSSPHGRERLSVEVLGMQVGFQSGDKGEYKTVIGRPRLNRGHLAFLEIGWNQMVDVDYYLYDEADHGFMKNDWRSLQFGLTLAKMSFDLDRSGTTSFTIGWQGVWNTYQMSKYAALEKRGGIAYPVWSDTAHKSSRIFTLSLRVPFQFEINDGDSGWFWACGGYFGVAGGNAITKSPTRNVTNPYINPFEFGISLRMGWRGYYIYALGQYTNLFMNNRGPMFFTNTFGIGIDF